MARTWFLLSVMSILLVVQVQCYSMAAAETNIHTDQSSLVALKSYITYDPKNILAKDWSNSIFICNWTGVTCGLHHNQLRVVSLNLSYMGLVGTVPPHLGNLSFLVNLTAKNNSLQGNLPIELSNLSQLKLISFGFNELTGEIPSWLGSLPKLAGLNLYGNQFTGSIPTSICNLTSVERIYLFDNQLSGSIPKNMKNLILLKILDLSYNNIEGSIPKDLGNLTLLKELYLQSNKIEGFPKEITSIRLETLDVFNNSLKGPIPLFLFNMSSLKILALSINKFHGSHLPDNICQNLPQIQEMYFHDSQLNGPIPSKLWQCKELRVLVLAENDFSGVIPKNIGNLTKLRELDLGNNKLTGDLELLFNKFDGPIPRPGELLGFDRLEFLDLSDNQFQGEIPSMIGDLKSLTWLIMSSNDFEGPIPSSLGNLNRLQLLDLSNNKLTGRIPQLENNPVFCSFSDLEIFDVSNNSLSDIIPQCLGSFSKSLEVLNMKRNNFSGEMPRTFLDGSSLKNLDLSHNQLEGTVPQSLIKCSALEVLNLGYNQLNDTFPFWLQDLKDLQVLSLRSNKFHGPIWKPKKFRGFVKLRIIDLSFNNFNGILSPNYFGNWSAINAEIPVANKSGLQYMGFQNGYYKYYTVTVMNKAREMVFEKILTIFTAIDLSNNNLTGEIPTTIGDLQSLIVLNLSSNNFEGLISSSFGNLKQLESLDLSNNKLSGRIPPELASLTFLAYLNLSENQLWGPIPQGGQINTFQSSSFEGNAELCGFPLSTKCESSDETPILDHEFESESGFGWKAVLIGYGCGFVVGMVYGRFIISKHPNLLTRIYGRKL